MSYQECTSNKEAVSEIIRNILKDEDHPNTELLIYFEDNEWCITKDKRFYSYGLKVEDKLVHLENLIRICEGQLKRIEDMTNIQNIKGILKDVAYGLNEGMVNYKNNKIEWSL